MKVTRTVLVQALKVAQSTKTDFPMTRGLASLVERGLGDQVGPSYRIDRSGRRALRDWLRSEGVDWTLPLSALNHDRVAVAGRVTNEKVARPSADPKRVLLKPMGHDVRLNNRPLPLIDGAFVSMDTALITGLYAHHLMIVENKAAFGALDRLSATFDRHGVMAVYRSDPQYPFGQQWAREAELHYGIPLAAYMDFDPAGISLGLSSGAKRLLVPDLDALTNLKGSGHDFRNQHLDWQRLNEQVDDDHPLAPWVALLGHRKAGFTQERLIAHRIPHRWVELPMDAADGR